MRKVLIGLLMVAGIVTACSPFAPSVKAQECEFIPAGRVDEYTRSRAGWKYEAILMWHAAQVGIWVPVEIEVGMADEKLKSIFADVDFNKMPAEARDRIAKCWVKP
jgi:hypothetical protein